MDSISNKGKRVNGISMRRFIIASFLVLIFVASLIFAISSEKEAKDHGGFRSSELQIVVTSNQNLERKDYYYSGNLTIAVDKHYATVIKTRTGNTVLEQYFDDVGMPAIQLAGHYGLLREYDDENRNYKTTYLDADGQPMLNTSGYCFWIRSFNEDGKIEYEHYYGIDGRAVKHSNGSCGKFREYEYGRNTEIVYLDADDNPVTINSGYAIVRRTYYETSVNEDRIENEFYFDINETPVALRYGQYGIHYDYDELGRKETLTYLDASGSPMATNLGFTSVKRTFYPDDTVETEMYFDETGSSVSLSAGQYGIKRFDGKRVYLDKNGREIFDLNIWLHNNPIAVIVIAVIVVLLSLFIGKKGNCVLLVLYFAFILYMTILYRPDGESRAELELFWSYRQFLTSSSLRLEILNNIWLFIPFGAILYSINHHWQMIIVPVALSVIIEIVQYHTGIGLAEIDDVISNGTGAFIGFGFGYALEPIEAKLKQRFVMKA